MSDPPRAWAAEPARRFVRFGFLARLERTATSGRTRPPGGPPVGCPAVRAVVCHELGPPSLLRVEERPDPVPSASQIVVEVERPASTSSTASSSPASTRSNPSPFTPGSEVAGVIAAVGDGVDHLGVGDRVMASTGLGGYASHVVVPPYALTAIPEKLDAARAATFTQSFSTCLFALRQRARVEPGESVLVLGAGVASVWRRSRWRGRWVAGERRRVERRQTAGGPGVGGRSRDRHHHRIDQGRRSRLGGRDRRRCGG